MCGFKNSSDSFGLLALTPKLDEHVCGYVQCIKDHVYSQHATKNGGDDHTNKPLLKR